MNGFPVNDQEKKVVKSIAHYVVLKLSHGFCRQADSSSIKRCIQDEIPLLQTEWKFQHSYCFLPACESFKASAKYLPPLVHFPSEPQGVSACDLISTRKLQSTNCSNRHGVCVLCSTQQAGKFTVKHPYITTTATQQMLCPTFGSSNLSAPPDFCQKSF